MEKTLNPL